MSVDNSIQLTATHCNDLAMLADWESRVTKSSSNCRTMLKTHKNYF